jgi:hypothetical protein
MAKGDKFEEDLGSMFVHKPKSSYNNTLIQSLFPAHLKYQGAISGKLYEWPKAGDIVAVDEADVADLLSKRIGSQGCCGFNPQGNQVFALLNK